jgi:hypothetical protein
MILKIVTAAIKSHFLHQPVMDALLRLNVALTEAATAAGNPDLTEDVEKLCGWLWKMVESASMDGQSGNDSPAVTVTAV